MNLRSMILGWVVLQEEAGGDKGGGGGGEGDKGGGGDKGAPVHFADTFENKDVQTWVKSFGEAYKTPEAIATKAFNLERILGADKSGRAIIPPKDDAPPEEKSAFWRKIGAPEKIEGYKVPAEMEKDPMFGQFREAAHKMGMPAAHFEGVMSWAGAVVKKAQEDQVAAFEQRAEADMTAIRELWKGNDEKGIPIYDKNVEMGRRFAKQFFPHKDAAELGEIINKMEGALGTRFVMEFLAKGGASIGEHGFVDNQGGNTGGAMSPEGARIRLAELKADPSWTKKFADGDAEAVAEHRKLIGLANPPQQQ